MTAHTIETKPVGKYTLCRHCQRGVVLVNGQWRHIRRTRWTDDQ